MPGARSQKIFDNIQAKLKNLAGDVEDSEGIIWGDINEAQRVFMEELKTTRIERRVMLIPDVGIYQMDPDIMEITDIIFPREEFNPRVRLTNTSTFDMLRGVEIIDTEDITDYDIMIVRAFIRPVEGEVIDATHNPVIEPSFDKLMEKYVLSGYRHINKLFPSQEQVTEEVIRTRNRLYGLNAVGVYQTGGAKF